MTFPSKPSDSPIGEVDAGRLATPRPCPRLVANAIREGRCPSDRAFDRFLLPDLQVVSHQYWTPTAVAVRAAQWFDELGVRRVLDVGSGAGKFCVAAALASEASFVGVEQRARLVDAARELARVFDVSDRVQFVHGLFDGSASLDADAYYFFNSFGENLFEVEHRLDDDVDLGPERFRDDVVAAERMLRGAPVGTHLLTYNGFGGMVPDSYAEVRVDRELPCVLRMWRKNQPGARAHDEKASSLRTRTAQCL